MSKPYRPPWNRRWLVVWTTLVWCAGMLTYLGIFGTSDGLRENAFVAIAGLAASVVLGYCGFAAYDDKNYMTHLRHSRPRRQQREDEYDETGPPDI